jgi:hypothetical protein
MEKKTPCANYERNQKLCTCPKLDCPNHGTCCDCLQAHLGRNTVPSCVRQRAADHPAFRDYLRGLAA